MIKSRWYSSYYWVLVIGGVLVPSIVFLFLGYDAARAVTPQTKGQVANVMIGFLTVDGVLLGLSTRFRESLGEGVAGRRLANMLEALQVSVLTISLLWSLVTLLYASFSDDIGLVSAWFQSSIGAFYIAIAIYSSFAILSRKEYKRP